MNPLEVSVVPPKVLGPRGGDVNRPAYHPEARKASFNGNLDETKGELRFHNSKPDEIASKGHVRELPWHRMAAYMLVAGRTNSEIAAGAGVDVCNVTHLRAERWFQELCATIANTEGEAIVGLIQSEVAASVEKIRELRDNSDSERIQLAAAIYLTDQGQGKAVQKVISAVSHSNVSPTEEMAQLEAELATLRRRREAEGT